MTQQRVVHLLDSIARITHDMANQVVVTGSHGGTSAAGFVLALTEKPHAVFFNDAGIGKDEAGIAALSLLQAVGVIAAVYAHTSARIGDANDGLNHGVITRGNGLAQALGIAPSQSVREGVQRLL